MSSYKYFLAGINLLFLLSCAKEKTENWQLKEQVLSYYKDAVPCSCWLARHCMQTVGKPCCSMTPGCSKNREPLVVYFCTIYYIFVLNSKTRII